MILKFNKFGTLPPSIHEATLDEIESRFVTNYRRKDLYEHLLILIDDLKKIGCKMIFIDGSFVTNKTFPGDIDLCWDNRGFDLDDVKRKMPILFDFSNGRYLQKKKYKADIFPAYIIESDSGIYFLDFFQKDKNTGNQKGIIKLKI
jgi:hypothetical protein